MGFLAPDPARLPPHGAAGRFFNRARILASPAIQAFERGVRRLRQIIQKVVKIIGMGGRHAHGAHINF